jgi:hypothetical protein
MRRGSLVGAFDSHLTSKSTGSLPTGKGTFIVYLAEHAIPRGWLCSIMGKNRLKSPNTTGDGSGGSPSIAPSFTHPVFPPKVTLHQQKPFANTPLIPWPCTVPCVPEEIEAVVA